MEDKERTNKTMIIQLIFWHDTGSFLIFIANILAKDPRTSSLHCHFIGSFHFLVFKLLINFTYEREAPFCSAPRATYEFFPSTLLRCYHEKQTILKTNILLIHPPKSVLKGNLFLNEYKWWIIISKCWWYLPFVLESIHFGFRGHLFQLIDHEPKLMCSYLCVAALNRLQYCIVDENVLFLLRITVQFKTSRTTDFSWTKLRTTYL